MRAADPAEALVELHRLLAGSDTEIAGFVVEPAAEPVLGLLVAHGPRAAAAPGEYALVIEAVREGYLLHYGAALELRPRILRGADADLALLAGDYLYALGLDRLAALGDSDAVAELGDLISLSAQVHAGQGPDGHPPSSSQETTRTAAALWLAAVTAVGAGAGEGHERAKAGLQTGDPAAPHALYSAAAQAARGAGISAELDRAAEALAANADAIHFSSLDPPGLG